MKRIFVLALVSLSFLLGTALVRAEDVEQSFQVKRFTPNEFGSFTKIFGEIRGPLRSEILKDKETDFLNADPFKYILKIKESKDVKKALASAGYTWESFQELMGNILLSYFSIQPQKTKTAIIRQMADYGFIPGIPEEYAPMVKEALKDEGAAAFAGMALDQVLQVPKENIALAKKYEKDIDRFFYTKYWKGKL